MAFLRHDFRNNILSRLHKICIVGCMITHHFGGVLIDEVICLLDLKMLTPRTGHNSLAPSSIRDTVSPYFYKVASRDFNPVKSDRALDARLLI